MRIGIVAPGRPITTTIADRIRAFAAVTYPKVDLVIHPQCLEQVGHFAGSDETRAAACLEFANDPGFDAIWFARGGYGSNRILGTVLPQLNRGAATKTYLGYSDVGFILGALYARRIGRPVHGPMPADITRSDGGATAGRGLGWLVDRDRRMLEPTLGGRPTAAFNLAILSAMIGTPYLPDLTDHVLMIEEVSEPMYRFDRMFFTLGNATQLKGIAGLALGDVTDIQENDVEFGEDIEGIARRWCRDLGVPYLGRAAIGHSRRNHVVPFGIA